MAVSVLGVLGVIRKRNEKHAALFTRHDCALLTIDDVNTVTYGTIQKSFYNFMLQSCYYSVHAYVR